MNGGGGPPQQETCERVDATRRRMEEDSGHSERSLMPEDEIGDL